MVSASGPSAEYVQILAKIRSKGPAPEESDKVVKNSAPPKETAPIAPESTFLPAPKSRSYGTHPWDARANIRLTKEFRADCAKLHMEPTIAGIKAWFHEEAFFCEAAEFLMDLFQERKEMLHPTLTDAERAKFRVIVSKLLPRFKKS